MKKIFMAGWAIASIAMLGIIIYQNVAAKNTGVTSTVQRGIVCTDCTNDKFYGVTIEDFMKNVARYKSTHYDVINKDPYMARNNFEDARSCWFSLDTLKKLICLIETYTAQLKGVGNPDSLGLGLRFYYAVYPQDTALAPQAAYISHHTLIMVPTYNTKGENIDFDPRYGVDIAKLLSPINFSKTIFAVTLSGDKRTDNSVMAKNQGQLCPPTCPANTVSTLNQVDLLPTVTYTTPN
jgi:hypothetical protein